MIILWFVFVGFENRDNLRRFFFKFENFLYIGNLLNIVFDCKKDVVNELGDFYNIERDYGYVIDDGNIEV